MKNTIISILLSIFFISCSHTTNFIRTEDSATRGSTFNTRQAIYCVKLDTGSVSFNAVMPDVNIFDSPEINNYKDVDLDKYVITQDSDSELVNNFYDSYNLIDENNYGYKSPKEFFTNIYNDTFIKIMQGESIGKTQYAPKKLNVKYIDRNLVKDELKEKYIAEPKDSMRIRVNLPKDLKKFCSQIKVNYPDADLIIISGPLYVTQGILEITKSYSNWISTGKAGGVMVSRSYKAKGVLICPKVVIDVDKAKVIGYHIAKDQVDPGTFQSFESGIESAIAKDVNEFNLFF